LIEYKWQILELSAEDGLIIHAKYFVTATENDKKVETEGNWWFQNPTLKVPFDQVTEQMVADWIDAENVKDGVNLITARLAEQLKSLEKTVVPPWKPQIFTPKL
jgi:putative intracellular protease/amidase